MRKELENTNDTKKLPVGASFPPNRKANKKIMQRISFDLWQALPELDRDFVGEALSKHLPQKENNPNLSG